MSALWEVIDGPDDELDPDHDTEDHLPAPTDRTEVDRLLRRLARLTARQTANHQLAEEERARITAWEREENAKLARRAAWVEELLESWHRRLTVDDPTAKTVSLPHGVLRLRQAQVQVDIDEDTFVPWALEHAPHLVRTHYSVDRQALRRAVRIAADNPQPNERYPAVDGNGEAIPGLWLRPRPPSHSISLATAHKEEPDEST